MDSPHRAPPNARVIGQENDGRSPTTLTGLLNMVSNENLHPIHREGFEHSYRMIAQSGQMMSARKDHNPLTWRTETIRELLKRLRCGLKFLNEYLVENQSAPLSEINQSPLSLSHLTRRHEDVFTQVGGDKQSVRSLNFHGYPVSDCLPP
ncbi:hypothetical protein [Kribbella sp. NPDC051718]|uniref:hypothetical protein n=1 Tax=Kribbella sp. NPDC051718 TaxID=3155168 RepID=UPI0034331E15